MGKAKDVRELGILPDSSDVDISNITGTKTSKTINIKGRYGFGFQLSGTSITSFKTEVSYDGTNWAELDSGTPGTLTEAYIKEYVGVIAPYARVTLTSMVAITAYFCVVEE